MNKIPVRASAKESALVAYVSIGNESRRLQNSQLNGTGEMQNLSGTRSTFGAPSCAASFSW